MSIVDFESYFVRMYFDPTPPCVRYIDSPRSKRCEGESVSLTQGHRGDTRKHAVHVPPNFKIPPMSDWGWLLFTTFYFCQSVHGKLNSNYPIRTLPPGKNFDQFLLNDVPELAIDRALWKMEKIDLRRLVPNVPNNDDIAHRQETYLKRSAF